LLAGAVGASAFAVQTLLPEGRVLSGVSIEGVGVTGDLAKSNDAALAAFATARLSEHLDRPVEIVAGTQTEKTTLRALLAPLDATSTIARARAIGRDGELDARL